MITAELRSGDTVSASASTATIPCVIDVCSAGIAGQWYTFNPGDQVTDQIGGGRGADAVLALLGLTGSTVYFTPAAPTWGPTPSVVHAGTGAAITVDLAPDASGPFDDHTIVGTITQAGPNGVAQIAWAYDGSTQIETMPVPTETGAELIGSAPLTPATLATVTGLTLVFAEPAAETLTFPAGSLAAAPAGLKAATATVASPVTLHQSDLIPAGIAATHANVRRIRFTTSGATASDAPATATVTAADYTGAAQSETVNLSQSAGSVSTTKAYDLTTCTISYPSADGTGALIAIGYEDAYASIAELVAEATALAVDAPLAVTASASQSASGTFLAFTSTATGGAAAVTMNASPGTAGTLLGFADSATTTGAAATFRPPWTGLVLTAAVGIYNLGDTYTIVCIGPEASISAIQAALAVGRANWQDTPFGFFAVTAPPSSASNAAALQAACSATVNPWRIDNTCPVWVMTGTPFHAASAVRATNDAAILATDTAVAATFAGNPAAFDLVAVDDCYVQGSSNLRTGSFRRSAVLSAAIKRASLPKLGSDIAEGDVPGVTLRGPDGATLARDESRATVKLGPGAGGSSGPGFSVLLADGSVSLPKFAAGVTRAGSTNRFRFSYVVAVGLEMSQTLFARARGWVGQTWPDNPATGQLLDSQAAHKADDAYNDLVPILTPEGKDPSVSSFGVAIDNSGKFVDTSNVPLNGSFVTLGLVLNVAITVTAFGTQFPNSP